MMPADGHVSVILAVYGLVLGSSLLAQTFDVTGQRSHDFLRCGQ